MTDACLNAVIGGFEARVDGMFRAHAGKPLVRAERQPPLGPGRGNYVRAYSFSIVEFAARCFTLDEQVPAANEALIENARHYVDHPKDINDRDSFHWHSEMLLRFVELYGRHGTVCAGRLSQAAEDAIMDAVWRYAAAHSKLAMAEVETSQTWHIHESENHHVQIFTTAWHFAKLARSRPPYDRMRYADGGTAADHHEAWCAYIHRYCLERAKKGLFVEMQNDGYNGILLKGIYNIVDFAEDGALREQAGRLLDLFFATWAQEQIDGVQGGGRARIYPSGSLTGAARHVQHLAWLYFGLGRPAPLSSPILSAATSGYRVPPVVADIALDVAGRGVYEVRQRPLGLVEAGFFKPPDYRMRTDTGGIQRYSYCTPAFIVGTAMVQARPMEDWAMISSQNRWHGVVFAGHPNARIVPQVRAEDDRANYNQQWSAQRKGTLICQKLRTSTRCGSMRVWVAGEGLSAPVERGGWVFVEAEGAYAAVRPVAGGYVWERVERPIGRWMTLEDEWASVIVEVARKGGGERTGGPSTPLGAGAGQRTEDGATQAPAVYPDFLAFQEAVLARPLVMREGRLTYEGTRGDRFAFYADQSRPPEINGAPVDYALDRAFESPFLVGDWDAGVVTVRKDGRERVLDFRG